MAQNGFRGSYDPDEAYRRIRQTEENGYERPTRDDPVRSPMKKTGRMTDIRKQRSTIRPAAHTN